MWTCLNTLLPLLALSHNCCYKSYKRDMGSLYEAMSPLHSTQWEKDSGGSGLEAGLGDGGVGFFFLCDCFINFSIRKRQTLHQYMEVKTTIIKQTQVINYGKYTHTHLYIYISVCVCVCVFSIIYYLCLLYYCIDTHKHIHILQMPWPRKVEKGSSNKDRFHWVRKSACAAVTSEPRQQLAQQCPLCDLMPSQSPWQKEQVQISHACHYTLNQPWSSDLKQSKQRHYYEHMYTYMYARP